MGLAALALCPSYSTVAPAGGSRPLLGTNPFAFAWPRPGGVPYVFDFATSVAARGEIELHRRAGKPLPEGWALDADGAPTTDPAAALAGAMLPFGAHKGSAISTMVELLAGTMIGDLTSAAALDALGTTTLAPRHGELILAFRPSASRPGGRAIRSRRPRRCSRRSWTRGAPAIAAALPGARAGGPRGHRALGRGGRDAGPLEAGGLDAVS